MNLVLLYLLQISVVRLFPLYHNLLQMLTSMKSTAVKLNLIQKSNVEHTVVGLNLIQKSNVEHFFMLYLPSRCTSCRC